MAKYKLVTKKGPATGKKFKLNTPSFRKTKGGKLV